MLRCKSQGKHSGQFEVRANDLGTSLHIKIFLSVTYRPRLKKNKSFIFRTDNSDLIRIRLSKKNVSRFIENIPLSAIHIISGGE